MIRSLEASVFWLPDGSLSFSYCLFGDIARLRIPTKTPQGRYDGLWEHTCFEAFVAIATQPDYLEFNFSPSGQWAAYAFSTYRHPSPRPFSPEPPAICTRQSDGRLEVDATLPLDALPENGAHASLLIGLSAVIESADTVEGSHSYWALHHPVDRPDFHHRAGFALILPAHPTQSNPR